MAVSNAYYLERTPVLSETIMAAVDGEAHRFLNRSGTYPAGVGGYAAGVTLMSFKAKQPIALASEGVEVAEVGAAIPAVDTPLIVDTTGKVRPLTDPATQHCVGYAKDPATGIGIEFIRVKLGR